MPSATRPWTLDARSLALGRAALGLATAISTVCRLIDLPAHFTDAGVLPRAVSLRQLNYPTAFKLFFLSGTTGYGALLLGLHLVLAVMLIVGYRTRLAAFGCFLLTLGERERNLLTIDGCDDLLLAYLLWAAFLPLGARASLDRLRAPAGALSSAQPPPTEVTSLATLGLLLQVSFVYCCAAFFKTGAPWRIDGSAVYYALSLDHFALPPAIWLRSHRELCQLLTFSTLGLEFGGPLLLWVPRARARLRMLLVLAFVSMHLGFALCLDVGIFSLAASSAWLMVLPSGFWERLPRPATLDAVRALAARLPLPLPGARVHTELAGLGRGLCAVALVLMGVGNAHALGLPLPKPVESVLQLTTFDQYWIMFSPAPPTEHGWMVFPARTASGTDVDLYQEAPLTWAKPDLGWGLHSDRRWGNYLRALLAPDLRNLYPELFRYLCRRWNSAHGPEEQVQAVQAVFMHVETTPTEPEPPPVRELVSEGRCEALAGTEPDFRW